MTAGTLSFPGSGGAAGSGNGAAGSSKSGDLINGDGEAVGCACRVGPASSRWSWLGVAALGALVCRRRRRALGSVLR